MDLKQIKFAYENKLPCYIGTKPTDLNSEYFWLYREYSMFFTIKKRNNKSIEECYSTMDFYLSKEMVSEGEGSEYLLRNIYPNLPKWNNIHIDDDRYYFKDKNQSIINEYNKLKKEETIWYHFYDENNKLSSGYKLKE